MDLREGPDANFYEITVLTDMLLAIGISLVSIYGIFFDWAHHGAMPETPVLVGVPLASLSTIGLVIGFARNRSHSKRIAALTLACSLTIPCWTILSVGKGKWNIILAMLIGPGILLAALSSIKLMQLRDAPR